MASGTLKAVSLDGNKFNAFGDVDLTQIGGGFDNESIMTSGGNFQKKVKNNSAATGITLYITDLQHDILSELNDRIRNFPINFTTTDNNVYRAIGFINYQNRTTADNKATVDLFPESAEGFILFSAG